MPGDEPAAPDEPAQPVMVGVASDRLGPLAAAVAFLTCVPLGRRLALGPGDVVRGAVLFPLVGAGVGAAVGGTALALDRGGLPPFAAAGLALAAGAVLTGGLHLDALADAADALGARSRERALEVMRDPRIGSFGATALVLDLLVKAAALAALLDHGVVAAAVAAGALSRATAPALAAALPPARPEGSGAALAGRTGRVAALAAAALAVLVAGALLGSESAPTAVAAAGTAVVVGTFSRRLVGGATGDTLGAAVELSETLALVAAAAGAG